MDRWAVVAFLGRSGRASVGVKAGPGAEVREDGTEQGGFFQWGADTADQGAEPVLGCVPWFRGQFLPYHRGKWKLGALPQSSMPVSYPSEALDGNQGPPNSSAPILFAICCRHPESAPFLFTRAP